MNCIIGADKGNCNTIEEFVLKTNSLNLIGKFSDQAALKNQLLNRKDIIIAFLDIEILGRCGFEFLRNLDYPINTIIITSSDQYALKAYNFNIVDYLVEPVSYSRFYKAVDRAAKFNSQMEVSKSFDTEIYVKDGSSLIKLKLNDIIYINAYENYVIIKTTDKKYTIHFTLKALEDQLPSSIFIRVHRSYIVNKNTIQTINENSLYLNVLNTLKEIPVGKSYRSLLLNNINVMTR